MHVRGVRELVEMAGKPAVFTEVTPRVADWDGVLEDLSRLTRSPQLAAA